MLKSPILLTDREIIGARPSKNPVDPYRPGGFFVEPERQASGAVEDVATVLLVNRECPFRCLMCDLWKNTTDEPIPAGAIPAQLKHALTQLTSGRHIKLYNSGNFFDSKAVPRGDFAAIAQALKRFKTVIVENHPKLCNRVCLRFRDLLQSDLEIAMGLETVHPEGLAILNKRMSLKDFETATRFLLDHGIQVRTFVLSTLPFLSEARGAEWAVRSVDYAFECGVGCVSIIPTRAGNGIMEKLLDQGSFAPPTLPSIEWIHEQGLGRRGGRVFVDLWDIERFTACGQCASERIGRLQAMNLRQEILPRIHCDRCGGER